jgi:hypothetical protein
MEWKVVEHTLDGTKGNANVIIQFNFGAAIRRGWAEDGIGIDLIQIYAGKSIVGVYNTN